MTADETMKKKQSTEDAELALAALAASKNKGKGDCLTSRQMAELVEDRCPTAERQDFLDHLGECPECYREFLYLREEQLKRKKAAAKGRLARILMSRKVLGYSGSILGIAAAVAIFLNIRMDVDVLSGDRAIAPKEVEERRPEPAAPPLPYKYGLEEESGPPQLRQDRMGEVLQSDKERRPDKEAGSRREGQMVPEKRGTIGSAAAPESSRASASGAPKHEELLNSLHAACLDDHFDRELWQNLNSRLRRSEFPLAGEAEQEYFSTLLRLTEKITGNRQRETYCPEILGILATLGYR